MENNNYLGNLLTADVKTIYELASTTMALYQIQPKGLNRSAKLINSINESFKLHNYQGKL